ncbi:MAG: hypothetical protein QXW97_01665 [Candidatus Pacearchaeota archaeon]
MDKYLDKVRKLEELRRKYYKQRNEKNYGRPAKLSDIKEIYGERINSAKGCLFIMISIIKGYENGEYKYEVYDPIFNTVDERYQKYLNNLIKKENKTKEEVESIKKLQRKYEILYNKVSRINKKLIKKSIESRLELEESLFQEKDFDELEPTDEELRKIENLLFSKKNFSKK